MFKFLRLTFNYCCVEQCQMHRQIGILMDNVHKHLNDRKQNITSVAPIYPRDFKFSPQHPPLRTPEMHRECRCLLYQRDLLRAVFLICDLIKILSADTFFLAAEEHNEEVADGVPKLLKEASLALCVVLIRLCAAARCIAVRIFAGVLFTARSFVLRKLVPLGYSAAIASLRGFGSCCDPVMSERCSLGCAAVSAGLRCIAVRISELLQI